MTNAIEQSKREMYRLLQVLMDAGLYFPPVLSRFEAGLESYLELLRQDHEALHETARKRFEDIQSLEQANQKLSESIACMNKTIQTCAGHSLNTIRDLEERLANMTAERDHLRNRMQANEAREERCSTSGQTSGDRVSCATLDGKTAAILGAVVDVRQIVSDWAVYGYSAKKQMKKLAYAINNNPELHSAMLQFEKGDTYAAWFIANGEEPVPCMHSFHPAFPSGEQCVFCGVGK